MSILLVGETNPWGGADMALYHLPRQASGNRLREHLGLRDATYAKIAKTNLCEGPWHLRLAREHAQRILRFSDWTVIVLLGRKVRQAFGEEAPRGVFELHRVAVNLTTVSLPHPSGLNRDWGKPGARDRARKLLRRVAPGVPWGEE